MTFSGIIIEAKDIGKSLASKEYKEQFDRYKNALDNLIITDYLDFWFYRNGELTKKIAIAKIEDEKIIPLDENFNEFINLIKDFTTFISQTIKSSQTLAKMMAGKARLLEDVIEKAVMSDDELNEADNSLKAQMNTFKRILIHDITPSGFADVYAQTIAYGMFAARLHDTTLEDFSREEAVTLIPRSNPFLRSLFSYISGAEIDNRIIWIVDSLAEIFKATDIRELLKDFGSKTGQNDPIIHFYETFLGEYNPALRKARGVWYTPQPVVNFIVRACDDVLKNEFDVKDGLADTTKIKIKVDDKDAGFTPSGKQRQKEVELHKIQILDPATGTGTFLAEIVKHINTKFKGMSGLWSKYVEDHLVPRLNGFELLMASYAMAHLKLDLLLTESGYKPINQKRLKIFLTNSLEEAHPETDTLFASWLSTEANEANKVKKETPVMVVVGNPPYAVSSSNKGKWIGDLLKDYKKDLNERKINLDDDYIKFIRYGQYYVEKNGEGVLAYISNNSFIDGITHRQMRKSLLETFDKIYILDLHGNSKKKETAPDGSPDQNVFDIMQGVSINIFVKTSKRKTLADVYHYDLYGKRDLKYNFLDENNINSIIWNKLDYREPEYFFVKKDFELESTYIKGFKVEDIFLNYNSGIQTKRDSLTIQDSAKELLAIKIDLTQLEENVIREKYQLIDSRDWSLKSAINDLKQNDNIQKIAYRPFDKKYTFLSMKSKAFLAYPRYETMKNLTFKNYALIFERGFKDKEFNKVFMVKNIVEVHLLGTMNSNAYTAPLYLYPNENSLDSQRTPNLNLEIVSQIEKALNLPFVNEKEQTKESFAPIDILDYIYAVLHSPSYREKYKEFLKIDFPRVPFPDIKTFWDLVEKGGELRSLHLLENPKCDDVLIEYAGDGDNIITRKIVKKDVTIEEDKVTLQINDTQYFKDIPLVAWEFYIGGYQPAQKWLKDRNGRELQLEDIRHYFKIITTLVETDKLMKEIDTILKV